MASSYRAKHVAVQVIRDIALRLCGWLKTICKRSGAGVWNFDIDCLLFLVLVGASNWSSFLHGVSVGPKLHPWPWVMGLCRMEARLLGKEYGGFLRRSCVSAIDFVVISLLCVLITLSVLMQRIMQIHPDISLVFRTRLRINQHECLYSSP